ncbi:histidine kinase [Flammeovirga yaeyamensis]|uniref:Histidine kinase n=1 Tax=Flammeovirga yaeyamensis TaxID=367791 RepID=A0AAX1NDX2_9BACT|nr:histidine kinase [Flammeovirga yaeyamensis]MBB3696836.1 sensor histidine kinase YesM [Flammeovirga yaeyamensis]NMF33501.1 histidine kinase [Flammeovirga yaeyamensis]QWG05226.1 histidine kinase [Flammeovirga yaeyamensis]
MKNKIQRYGRSIIIGSSAIFLIMVLMTFLDMIIIPYGNMEEIVSVYLFWAIVASLVTHHFNYLKTKVPVLLKIAGLFLFLIFINIYDESADKPQNYLTLSFAVSWFSILVYFIMPSFFIKYSKGYFGALLGVVLYANIFYEGEEKFEHIQNLIGISIPILFTLWIYEQWRWIKSLKNEKAKAELQLLKSQINPHFFFNTLNNLYGLTVEKSDKAPEVVLKLGDMMRYTIYEGKEERVPIQDEIQYLENYIELHKIRYQKNVQVHFINSVISDFQIAPLLYIILVENAFKHGVETLIENAYIFIEIEEAGNSVSFTIENNFDRAMQDNRVGIGLENLKKRLELIYPNKYTFDEIKSVNTYKTLLTIDLS